MSEQSILDFLKDAILSMTDDSLDLGPEMRVADLGLESLDHTDLLLQIEKRFAIKLDGEEISCLGKSSLGDTARFILSRLPRP